jgi:hypothetical protein
LKTFITKQLSSLAFSEILRQVYQDRETPVSSKT